MCVHMQYFMNAYILHIFLQKVKLVKHLWIMICYENLRTGFNYLKISSLEKWNYKGDREVFQLLTYFPNGCNGQGWLRPSPGTRNGTQVSDVERWGKGPWTCNTFNCPSEWNSRKLYQKWTQNWNQSSHISCWCHRRLLNPPVPQRWPWVSSFLYQSKLIFACHCSAHVLLSSHVCTPDILPYQYSVIHLLILLPPKTVD